MNVEAIRTLKQIEMEGCSATLTEQEILSCYVDWGGVPDAFDNSKTVWLKLKGLLTLKEYKLAKASTLNAHYTSPVVIRAIYEAVGNMGFETGNILEPSCGVGNFFGLLPENMAASRLLGVELDSITGRIAQQLHEAVSHIHGEIARVEALELAELEAEEAGKNILPADPSVKEYSYAVIDGEVYYRESYEMTKLDLNAATKNRIKGMVELRDCVRGLINLQMQNEDEAAIDQERQKLNTLYGAFSAKFSLINNRENSIAFSQDDAYYLLCSLEHINDDGNLERKADMFTKRTIKSHQAVSHVDTALEALAVSIGEHARVDLVE